MRRIGSIALVHETLSREAAEDVPFADVARPLVRMVEESLVSPERPVTFRLAGDAVTLPAAVATPLALVLTELLQNAVDHAFRGRQCGPDGGGGRPGPHGEPEAEQLPGDVLIQLSADECGLRVLVIDDGAGLPAGLRPRTVHGAGAVDRAHARARRAGRIDGDAGPPGRRRPGHAHRAADPDVRDPSTRPS